MQSRLSIGRWVGKAANRLRHETADPQSLPDGARASFAVHGEDLITRELLWRSGRDVSQGIYVDVGAYQPWHASNTATFYLDGWSGIAVEPNPTMAALFRQERPRDIVVEAAVAAHEGTATLYSFGAWASSNTLDPDWVSSVVSSQNVEVEEEIAVRTITLAGLLDEYLPKGRTIDLLSVDVEGLDSEVLESNDWSRYRPSIVAVEEYDMDLSDPASSQIYRYMTPMGYHLAARAVLTNFYVLA